VSELRKNELAKRARRVRLVVTDVDGVWTDAGVYYGARGEVYKRFSVRDGMGVERLRDVGIATAIISGESSPSVRSRARKLQITHCYLGVRNKPKKLDAILKKTGLRAEQVAYIGDDVNDLEIIARVARLGLTGAPADAFTEVADGVHYLCQADGGHGAFRDFAEWILGLRAIRYHTVTKIHENVTRPPKRTSKLV